MASKPEVTRDGLCVMQVCVPREFTDEQVEQFANSERPTGIASQWSVQHQGDETLNGSDERVQCEHPERGDCVHVVLAC